MADEQQPDSQDERDWTPHFRVSLSGEVHGVLSEIESVLVEIRDDRSRSPGLRSWAQRQLDEAAELRDRARADAASAPDRVERLAAALRLDQVPAVSGAQQRELDAAVARAEADADRLYRDQPGRAGRAAA